IRSPISFPQVPSRTNVTCTVARYSAILPFSTAAFSFRTSIPVMPRSVRLARSSALRTASSQLWGEAPITCVMRATAIRSLQQEDELHLHAILGDVPALHLDALARHLEPGDVAHGPGRAGHAFFDGFPEPVGGRRDDLRHPRNCHAVGVASALPRRKPRRPPPLKATAPACESKGPHASAPPRPSPAPQPCGTHRAHRRRYRLRRGTHRR